MNFHCRKLNSLVSVHPPTTASPGVRFTVCPIAFLPTKVLSRVVLMCRAIAWMASSQEISSQRSEPGRRTLGARIRFGLSMSYLSVAPFGQSVPRLVGQSGSPSTCTTVGATFFALSPRVWMITPHATAQYGQMLRVSVVRAILNCRISARARDMSNPTPAAALATAAPFKNVRRLIEPPCRFGPSPPRCPFSRFVPVWGASGPTFPSRTGAASAAQFLDMPVDKGSAEPSNRRLERALKRSDVGATLAHGRGFNSRERKKTMRSRFSFVVLAVASLAAPAFARNDAPAGQWDGILVRKGVQTPIALRLVENGDIWRGNLEVDGASSPLARVRVTDNNVHFELPGQGVFDGTFSSNSMTGSVSGSGSAGSFALTLEESQRDDLDAYGDSIDSEGP